MILTLFGLALAGCGSTYSTAAIREADEAARAAYADCDAQLKSGVLQSYRQAARCAQPKVLGAYKQSGYPYIDLVELELLARATGADHIDTGYAKVGDVDRDIAELERRIAEERQRRQEGELVNGGSAPYVPPQRLLAGLTTLTERAPPASASSNCFQIGSFSHCDNSDSN